MGVAVHLLVPSAFFCCHGGSLQMAPFAVSQAIFASLLAQFFFFFFKEVALILACILCFRCFDQSRFDPEIEALLLWPDFSEREFA